MLCSEAVKVNENHLGGQVVTLKCKRWSCPLCHPDNRWRVIRAGRRGKPDKFLTLTCDPARFESPDDAARKMVAAFKSLIRMIREAHPDRSVEYLRVFEKTKKGWPHLHILLRAPFLRQGWLSDQWAALTGAFIVDIRAVDSVQKAVFYVTKYIGKELGKFEGVTRWFRSRGWNEPEEDEGPKVAYGNHWEQVNRPPHLVLWRYMLDAQTRGDEIIERTARYVHWKRVRRRDDD